MCVKYPSITFIPFFIKVKLFAVRVAWICCVSFWCDRSRDFSFSSSIRHYNMKRNKRKSMQSRYSSTNYNLFNLEKKMKFFSKMLMQYYKHCIDDIIREFYWNVIHVSIESVINDKISFRVKLSWLVPFEVVHFYFQTFDIYCYCYIISGARSQCPLCRIHFTDNSKMFYI